MCDLEARAAELGYLRCVIDDIAEPDRRDEARPDIDQRHGEDVEFRRQLVPGHTERGLEQRPGAGVEDLEESGVENDAGRIAIAPFDPELPAVDEIGHGESWVQSAGPRCPHPEEPPP